MAQKNIPEHELKRLLNILGRHCGGMISRKEVLERLDFDDETFQILEDEFNLESKTFNGVQYYRSDDIDNID